MNPDEVNPDNDGCGGSLLQAQHGKFGGGHDAGRHLELGQLPMHLCWVWSYVHLLESVVLICELVIKVTKARRRMKHRRTVVGFD